jgi:AGCS family alanine or glycine:cation symporter
VSSLLSEINGFVWGPFTLWLIGLTGLYLMLGLKFQPLIRIGFGFREAIASIRSSSVMVMSVLSKV